LTTTLTQIKRVASQRNKGFTSSQTQRKHSPAIQAMVYPKNMRNALTAFGLRAIIASTVTVWRFANGFCAHRRIWTI
jgi:hypothetical protein